MSELVVVGISDCKMTRNPNVLVTHALGSCVGICLYDRNIKIGGLAHIMLPDSTQFAHASINRMKFADTAIIDLIQSLQSYGADIRRITAKIAGGAQMFAVQGNSQIGSIGIRNVESVKVILRNQRISILAEDTGLDYGRTVYFDVGTGLMKVKSLNNIICEM